jgi:hypothetical protein
MRLLQRLTLSGDVGEKSAGKKTDQNAAGGQ